MFVSPFGTLARLHDKGAFERLLARLGVPVPETVVVTSDEELREATDRLDRYFARGVFSRGGICCLSNTGPLGPRAGDGRGSPHARVALAGAALPGR